MKAAKILLRTASILMLIHTFGHTFGHIGWKKADDPVKQAVISQMTGPKFPFMGTFRSLGDYYDGYGYAATIGMLLFTFILWFASSESEGNNRLAKKIILLVAVALLAWGIDEIIFFFPFATGLSLLASLCTFIAFYRIRSSV